MRKFIISDIHGNGNLYYSVISYLENISKEEDITLYINGDLIDRGLDSAEILLDVINRINSNNSSFRIVYLAGNHELMMHNVFEKRRKQVYVPSFNTWYMNGGQVTDNGLDTILNDKDKILKVDDFVSNLDLYKLFSEEIDGKKIVLVHASTPFRVKDTCDIKIKDLDYFNHNKYYLWAREDDLPYPFKARIGYKKYFSIVGHTPNNMAFGFFYDKDGNYLNIDGGSASYVSGLFDHNHFPLVEIKDNYLSILTFNSGNEIIYGNYFVDNNTIPFSEEELNKARSYLNSSLKIKRLVRLDNGTIGYKD